jgi:hypothetical protein
MTRGRFVDRTVAPKFWEDIDRLSHEIGTAAPDHVIAGIDDKFFVTEHPVAIQGARRKGRTLFVSLYCYTLPLPAQMSVRAELVGILEKYHSRQLTAAECRRQQESDSEALN